MKTVFYGVLAFLLFIAAVVGSFFYAGWTLTMLWQWIVIPTFNVKAITIAQAIGLSIVSGFFLRGITMNVTKDKSEDESTADKFVGNMFKSYMLTSLFLGIGYAVHLFM